MKCYAKSSENLIVQLANLPPKPPFLSKSFHLFSCTGKTHYLCISSAKNKEQNKTFLPFNFQNIGRQLVQYAASRSKTCEPEFLYNVIASDKFINYVMSGAKGVKMPRGDKNQMESFSFSIPAVVEQRKISRLFQLLDERIVTQNKIIEKLQSLIKGITILLTAKGKPNTTIAQCLECHSSTLQESEVSHNGLYKVFGANGLVGYTDMPQMNGDAILIIKDGSGVGTTSYAQGEFSVISTLNYLTAISNYDLRYLYFVLSVFNFQSYKTGMAIPHIYFKDYGNAKIFCPPLSEQKRIANVLGKLESKLCLEQNILASFNLQKRYLLGQMFI